MALQCTVCSAELEALGARRCRKCRQLVCEKCIETGSQSDSEGACCITCASQEETLAEQREEEMEALATEAEPVDSSGRDAPLILPTWAWAVIGVMLSVIFGLIVYFPTYQLRSLKSDLFSSSMDRRERGAEGLVELGTDSALEVLVDAVRTGPPDTQLAAAQALGDFPSARVPDMIDDLLSGQLHAPVQRAALEESLIRHQSLFGENQDPE